MEWNDLGIRPQQVKKIVAAGYTAPSELKGMSPVELMEIKGIGAETAIKIHAKFDSKATKKPEDNEPNEEVELRTVPAFKLTVRTHHYLMEKAKIHGMTVDRVLEQMIRHYRQSDPLKISGSTMLRADFDENA